MPVLRSAIRAGHARVCIMRKARIGRDEAIAEREYQKEGVIDARGPARMNDTAKITPYRRTSPQLLDNLLC